jgi:hypothetical protein
VTTLARITLEFRVVQKTTADGVAQDVRTAAAKAAARPASQPQAKSRSVIGGLIFVTTTIILSLLATTGSYALWNGKTVVNGSSLSSGSTALKISGVSDYTLVFPTTPLAPGKSLLSTATFQNTGTTPLSASAASTTILTNTKGMADYLTLTVTPVASAGACAVGLTGGTSASLASFTTTSAPYAMPSGASQIVCFELKLSSTAPSSVSGGAASFRMNISATQTRP